MSNLYLCEVVRFPFSSCYLIYDRNKPDVPLFCYYELDLKGFLGYVSDEFFPKKISKE